MTDNKGDLISREALKKKLQEYHDFFVNAWGGFKNLPPNDKARVDEITHCISEVVNAPTVEPPNQLVLRARDDAELELLKTAWGNGEICFTPIVAYTARPQGEWIIVKDEKYGDNVKCPFCGKELAGTDLNFCCKCGADMRGGK